MGKKVYGHDFDEKEVCRKCHKHITTIKMLNLCSVIGKEEAAQFRDRGQDD